MTEISTDRSRVDVEWVWGRLRETYWSQGIRREVVERAISNSMVAGAYAADGRQVGFARVVTDYATFAWVCDVVVDKAWRGRGLARGMIRAMMADPEVRTLRRWCLATRDAHGVYAPLGFRPVAADRWMERISDPSAWRE
jgi:GNAT superfamily N-acetyltransferase